MSIKMNCNRLVIPQDLYFSYPVSNDMNNAKIYVENAYKLIKQPLEIINIWCRGSSGAILATLFYSLLPDNCLSRILHCKKEGEYSHDRSVSPLMHATNIIIDDFVQSGETINTIYEKMQEEHIDTVDFLIVRFLNSIPNFVPKNIIYNGKEPD